MTVKNTRWWLTLDRVARMETIKHGVKWDKMRVDRPIRMENTYTDME